MRLREIAQQLDQSIDDTQRSSLQELLGDDGWASYTDMLVEGNTKEDFQASVVMFGLTLSQPEAFTKLLTTKQNEMVNEMTTLVKKDLGLE